MTAPIDFEARLVEASKLHRLARAEWKMTWQIEQYARQRLDIITIELARVESLAIAANRAPYGELKERP